jgi:hypothetical protein
VQIVAPGIIARTISRSWARSALTDMRPHRAGRYLCARLSADRRGATLRRALAAEEDPPHLYDRTLKMDEAIHSRSNADGLAKLTAVRRVSSLVRARAAPPPPRANNLVSGHEGFVSLSAKIAQRLMCGSSCKTTFSNELWTSIWPLYSIRPNFRNLFMK